MSKEKSESKLQKVRRIVAWLTIAVIVVLVIITMVCAFTGSPYFFGMLYLTIAVPLVLWIFMWFTSLVNGESQVIPKEIMELAEDENKQ